MLYAKVSMEAFEELIQEMNQTKDAKWYRRLKIIHLSSKWTSVQDLATLFDLSKATIREYITRYNQAGLSGLQRQYSEGPPIQIPFSKAEWDELLHQSPSQFDQLNTAARNWSQELLKAYFRLYHEVTVTQQALSACLKRHGFRWNRGKLKVTSPDPLYTVKRDRIEELKQKAEDQTLTSHDAPEADASQPSKPAKLVFFDITDLHWCPDVGHSYVPQGTQLRVGSPGNENPWYALLGSLIYPSGEGLYTIHTRKRHQEVREHLIRLIEREPKTFWVVIMDNASAHTTPKLDAFWEQYTDHICPVFLPTYSPHLNLIERLWRFLRGQMTRNQFYESLKDQVEAIVDWLTTVPFSRFCSLMGIDEVLFSFI